MALYAIGDLHLSLAVDKSMEIFGPAWEDYVSRIQEGLAILTGEDTLVLAGDTSWGMTLEEAEADFKFLDRFPGRKYLIKGNHDYWWTTAAKLRRFFDEKGIHTLDILHNNCALYGEYALCGTRGWFLEEEQKPHNAKVLHRGLFYAFSTIRPCTRAISARKSWRSWKSTVWRDAATAISTALRSAALWRKSEKGRFFP